MRITLAAFITLATVCSFHNHWLWSILNKAEHDLTVDILITPSKNNSLPYTLCHQMRCYSEWHKTQMGRKSQAVTLPQRGFAAFKCEATRKPPTRTSDPDWAEGSARSRTCTCVWGQQKKEMEAFSFKIMQCGVALLTSKKHRLSTFMFTSVEIEFWRWKMKKDDMAFLQCSQETEEVSHQHSSCLNSHSTELLQTFSNTNPLANNYTKLFTW